MFSGLLNNIKGALASLFGGSSSKAKPAAPVIQSPLSMTHAESSSPFNTNTIAAGKLKSLGESTAKDFPFTPIARDALSGLKYRPFLTGDPGADGTAGEYNKPGQSIYNYANKILSPTASKTLADSLSMFDKPTIEVASGSHPTEEVISHEMLHHFFETSPMGGAPSVNKENGAAFGGQWLNVWDKLKQSDKDIAPLLSSIDDHLKASGYDTTDPYSVANERFAYLGQRALQYGPDVIPKSLRPYYDGVINFPEKANPPSSIDLPNLSAFPSSQLSDSSQAVPNENTPDSLTSLKKGLSLLNPLKPATIRAPFMKAGQEGTLPIGGKPLEFLDNTVFRTIEALPSAALRMVANARGIAAGGKQASITVPFDVSRLGMEDQPGSNIVMNSGAAMYTKYLKLEQEHPGRSGINIALAALTPVQDVLNATIAGEFLTGVAKSGLKATGFSPDLDRALTRFGMKNSGLPADEFYNEFRSRFISKAETLIKREDYEGLDELGRSANVIATHLTGKGIPTLNRFGQIIQDVSRVALQDSKYGFSLHNPIYAELAPEAGRQGLPGYVEEPGQAPAFGLSTRRVTRVGGEAPAEGNLFKEKDLPARTAMSPEVVADTDVTEPKLEDTAPRGTKDLNKLTGMLARFKESLRVALENPEAHAKAYGPGKIEEYQTQIKNLSDRIAEVKKAQPKKIPMTEEDSLQLSAEQHTNSDYTLRRSKYEEGRVADHLDSVFADMKGVEVKDLGTKFTDTDLAEAKLNFDMTNEILLDHPGRALMKFVSPKTGRLPEVLGSQAIKSSKGFVKRRLSQFGKSGDAMATEILGQKGVQDAGADKAQKYVDDYIDLRDRIKEIYSDLQKIRNEVRLEKQRKRFTDDSRRLMAREVAKNIKALQGLVKAAEASGYGKGLQAGNEKVNAMVQRLKSRRTKILALQQAHNLTDAQMKNVRGPEDPRFMDAKEFNEYFQKLETRAELEGQKKFARDVINHIMEYKNYKNPENLRLAMELPKLQDMTLEDLKQYDEALSKYEKGDVFLGPRMIQTIMNTDLGDVKTVREIRMKLAEQSGTPIKDLDDVRGSWGDKYVYDGALAKRNPLYKYMVTEFTAKGVENDQIIHAIEHKLNTLAKAARRSRPLGIFNKLVPQDQIVFDWLETREDEKDLYAKTYRMTKQELEYAEFVQALYREWRDVLIEKGTLKKWRDAYITHTTRSFLERWKDDGFIRSVSSMFKNSGMERTDFDAVGDTGEVLGLEKFFKYSLPREGNLIPSKNVARVVMSYARNFYKKQALDAMIPKIEAYTFSLQRKPGPNVPKDPTGLGVDGKLQKFVKQWINNKKGRQIDGLVSQGSRIDNTLRALNLFLAVFDLALNLIGQTANMVGGVFANFTGLTTKNFIKGAARVATPRGRALMRKYPGMVGHSPIERFASAANDIGDTLAAGLFYIMSEGIYEQKAQFFLGSLSDAEFRSGEISPKRQAEIKIDMSRFHPMEDMSSLAGTKTEGKILTKYKTWAVPFLFTAYDNSKEMIRMFESAEGASGKAKTFKSRQAKEILKITVGAAAAYLFWNHFFANDPNDKSAVGRLKYKISQELSSSLSSLDPQTWLSVRPYEFAKTLGNNLHLLILLEHYTTSGNGYKAGDLKGWHGLKSQFTPQMIKQFEGFVSAGDSSSNSKPLSGKGIPAAAALKRLDKIKNVTTANAALKRLDRLKKLNNLK